MKNKLLVSFISFFLGSSCVYYVAQEKIVASPSILCITSHFPPSNPLKEAFNNTSCNKFDCIRIRIDEANNEVYEAKQKPLDEANNEVYEAKQKPSSRSGKKSRKVTNQNNGSVQDDYNTKWYRSFQETERWLQQYGRTPEGYLPEDYLRFKNVSRSSNMPNLLNLINGGFYPITSYVRHRNVQNACKIAQHKAFILAQEAEYDVKQIAINKNFR